MAVKFIKICGITDKDQALKISRLGATHIGVIYYEKSPRHTDLQKIKEIKNYVEKEAKIVAVTVNPSRESVQKLLDIVDMIQFHGDESIDFISQFPLEKSIKAFRIKSEEDIKKMTPFIKNGHYILIDAYKEGEYGGTGRQINPELARKVTDLYDRIILSGGLSPYNLKELLDYINPYGIDASSKLELRPGIKDLKKVERFIKIAKMER